jgi:cell division septum initiation protein DivIVA
MILDNEFILKQFEDIEQRVEKLIELCNALEATNLDQKNKIKSLEEEIDGKVEAEKSYAEEKALIRSKIDGLLVKLDKVSTE